MSALPELVAAVEALVILGHGLVGTARLLLTGEVDGGLRTVLARESWSVLHFVFL